MSLIKIYQCLCDSTRLRILSLLKEGDLCVCHLQRILGEPQVKVSKHLAYLRKRRLVECRRDGNWMIYRLPAKPSRELAANLACLQDCVAGSRTFRRDAARRSRLCAGSSAGGSLCCPPEGAGSPVGKREAP